MRGILHRSKRPVTRRDGDGLHHQRREPISPEQRSEIFKPFVQYDKVPRVPGLSRLVLCLARSLAEMHARTLELADDTLRTTFVLDTLRTRRRFPKRLPDRSRRRRPGPVPLLLLLVEDKPGTHGLSLKHKLAADIGSSPYTRPKKAVAVLWEQEVDIVVTDIALPGTKFGHRTLPPHDQLSFDLSHIPRHRNIGHLGHGDEDRLHGSRSQHLY